jgi:hypothetical protein
MMQIGIPSEAALCQTGNVRGSSMKVSGSVVVTRRNPRAPRSFTQ